MEFIPLDKYSKRGGKRKGRTDADQDVAETKKNKQIKKNEEFSDKKLKNKTQTKVFLKKKVKNKFRENLEEKRKRKKIKKREAEVEDEEEEENLNDTEEEEEDKDEEEENFNDFEEEEDEDEDEDEKNDIEEEGSMEESGEEDDEEEVEEKKEKDAQEAHNRKCKHMDEKKKNRLFVKFKKKIHSESQVKELHPDIRSVIFPRKKNTRWCWAVFASQERANEAFMKLVKNKEITVSKPTPYDKVELKREKKMKVIEKKKEARKKLQKMWM